MTFTLIKTPKVAKKMFPNYVWDITTAEKTIYLTFDDGPTPEITNWTLNTLKAFGAKATFFCIGNNVEKHPDIFQNIIDDGHVIGNHTYNHVKGWKTKTKEYLKNTFDAQSVIDFQVSNFKLSELNSKSQIPNSNTDESVIKGYTNQDSISSTNLLFRPPYGQIKPKQGKHLIQQGYHIIMWDVLSFDWDNNVSKETCLNNVINKATEGSIVVFHDSVKASKNMQYALPKVLEHFSKLGYTFKAINSNFIKDKESEIV